ncbi:MAG: hypothetical protein JWM11_1819 [Planctomycetaceae bacterium]|nr:hypothetical protein [Planctomycetaceae bacterium]
MVISVWNSFFSVLRSNLRPVTSSKRRRTLARLGDIERVEDRILMAGDLSMTDAYLVDANGVRMPVGTTPVIGEAVFIRVDWKETGLLNTDQYHLGFQLNQFPVTGAPPIGYFQGQNTIVNLSFTQFAGYAVPGTNNAQVILDVGGTVGPVAETNETNNVKNFSFTATDPFDPTTPSLDLPSTLATPVGGVPYKDWYLSYPDSDPAPVTNVAPNAFQDYLGGKSTIDQQFGDHYVETNFNDMDNGRVAAVAVAPGTVTSVVDGNFDRNSTSANRVGNSVTLDLGNGWTALYSNLMSGSILVKVGDVLSTTDYIGLLGSSGDSTGTQLTFKLLHNGQVVEPGYAAAEYFTSPLPYAGSGSANFLVKAPFSVIDSGITNSDPAPDFKERPQDYTTFSTSASSTKVWLWLQSDRNLVNEPITVTWFKPNGAVGSTINFTPGTNNVGVPNVFTLDNAIYKTATGTWQVAVTVAGTEVLRKTFSVGAGAGAPEIRLQQETVLPNGQPGPPIEILDNRTTPVDFGTLNPTDAAYDIVFTIQNTGASTLSFTNIVTSPGFIIDQVPPSTVAPGGSVQFKLRQEDPTTNGIVNFAGQNYGTLTLSTNDPDEAQFVFPLTGFINLPNNNDLNVTLPGPATPYLYQQSPQIIAPAGQVTTTFGDFVKNDTLDVDITSGGRGEDVLGIRNQGIQPGQIGVSGSTISFGGSAIATFSVANNAVTGAQRLHIVFSTGVSAAVATDLMQNITYFNSSVIPNTHPRYVQFAFNSASTTIRSNLPVKMIDILQDIHPPKESLVITPVTIPGTTTQFFTIDYTDDVAVDGTTPDAGDILDVINPAGGVLFPQFVSKDSSANGPLRTTTWILTGPGGFWDIRDNGVYTINLVAHQVKDINGNESPAGLIGTFTINIPNSPPVITNANSIPAQITQEDTPTAPILIQVDDLETDPADLVLTASSSDPSIVANNGFSFTGSGTDRTLVITPVPNAFGVVTITLQLLDDNGGVTTKTFRLTVQSVNDLPVISAISSQDIQQDTSTPVINFTVSDIETPAASLLISAASDNTSLIKNSKLVLGGTPSNPTLIITPEAGQFGRANVTISVTDTDGGITTEVIPVLVRQNSQPPVIPPNQVLNVPENSAFGTAVGTIAASDPDSGQTLTYAITGGDPNNAFSINSTTGVITVRTPVLFDFETLPLYTLNIAVTDSSFPGVTTIGVITVNVTNLNETPVVQNKTLNLGENPPMGTAVTVVTATDVDVGQTRTFSISGGNPNNAFVIDPVTGVLSVNNPAGVDFETTPTIILTIAATDNGVPSLTGFGTVTIHVGNVNEPPVINAQTLSVPENSAVGAVVGNVAASDPDIGQTLTYSILSGNSDGAFAINPNTGVVTVANTSKLNFETQPSHQLIVQVADNASPSLTASNFVTISVTDVNESPTIASQAFQINENSLAGTVVGTVVTGNPESSQSIQFSIIAGNSSGGFTINPVTGVLQVLNPAVLDFETNPQFVLTVQAVDNGIPAQTSTGNVTILLNNLNETPLIQNQNFTPNENLATGAVVGNVVASDPDAGQSLTYSITSSSVPGAFAIDPQTGALTVANAAAMNFEVNPTITLTVKVTDNGGPTLFSSALITLNLNNVNDPPVVSAQTFTFNENQLAGFVAGSANATDEDQPPQLLTYSIIGGDNGGAFTINPATGVITVANAAAVDFETSPQFQLQVQARDNGTPPRSGVGVITINLNDVNEPPIVPTQVLSVPENSPIGFQVGHVVVNNPETSQALTYQVLSGNEAGAFSVDPNT